MGAPRSLLAVGLLVALGGGAAAVMAWTNLGAGGSGAFPVDVVGPGGAVVLSAQPRVENATALSVLLAACEDAGIAVRTDRYPGMGTYVRAIAGHEARGASGWIYEVERGGATISGDRSADRFPLAPGDRLRWSWTSGDGS